jgi:hypothetical protein
MRANHSAMPVRRACYGGRYGGQSAPTGSPRWCVEPPKCAVAVQCWTRRCADPRGVRHGGGAGDALGSAVKPLWAKEKFAVCRPSCGRNGRRLCDWHMGCIHNGTGDFVWKSGLIQANGNAAGNSAHLTPPAVGAECRQRFFAQAVPGSAAPEPPDHGARVTVLLPEA